MKESDKFARLKNLLNKEKLVLKEIENTLVYLDNTQDENERKMISSHLNSLKNSLSESGKKVLELIDKISLAKPLDKKEPLEIKKDSSQQAIKVKTAPVRQKTEKQKKEHSFKAEKSPDELHLTELEKITLKRLKRKTFKPVRKEHKTPSLYVKLSTRFFSKLSSALIKKGFFSYIENDLPKTNLQLLLKTYVSIVLFTTFLSVIASVFIFVFFLFFKITPELPIITFVNESLFERAIKIIWIPFAVPIGTFLFMYFYPSMERKSLENRIDEELPFAAIHMSAVSGSMIDPSKIFSIIIATKEYPNLEKEFIKLLNEINVLGHDLVTALRNRASNSPSKKLAELFNGLATTISSGGNLPEFFDKRAQTLLFDYRLEREKYTRTTETFMDIYISVVIAAPMILMLLLMMMKISGLGISLSTSMITLVMVLGVTLVNIIFLTFLHLKQPK